jgi:tetratricopeptide (TPR) repeat protein
MIEEFEENYFPSRALWWYTRQSFVYRLLKKALQIQNIELLLLFRFFIRDIERQLEKTKCTSPIRVYYGQIMSNDELQILRNNIGSLILINSFLSTSVKQQIQTYFSHMKYSNDFQPVLFDIEADPRLENIKPFSNITTQSYFPNEEQTLFMLGSIFRLIDVRHEHDGMWVVRMALCSENDQELKLIFDQNQPKDSLFFGQTFCELKKFDEAEKYYHHLLKSLPSDHEDIILYYDALGNLEKDKGDYDSSLEYFNKSLEMKKNIHEIDDPNIGDSYNNIGEIYQKKNDFKQALDSFNKAIKIFKKKLNADHPQIAICFNNIGHVYKKEKDYSKALEFYQKALVIRQKCFSPDHPQLADSYKNIGTAHEYLNHLDQALDNYDRSLKIYEKSVSPQHFVIGKLLKSIGNIYENKQQFQQAHSYYEKAATRFRNVLSATDPQIIQIQQDIQRVTAKLK